jgi:hypothetical protein
MSYLSGPNRANLIPARLESVTLTNATNDSDLGDLARSDVRAILTQPLEQCQILIGDCARASDSGRKFFEESVATIDPKFVDRLRKK